MHTSVPSKVIGHTKTHAPKLHSPRDARRVSTHLDVISTFPCKPFIHLKIATIIPRIIYWRLSLAATFVHSCCSMKPYAHLAGTTSARTSHGRGTIPSKPKARGTRKAFPRQVRRCRVCARRTLPVLFFPHSETLPAGNDGSWCRAL